MTIAQHGKTVINLDKDGINHLKEELDASDEEILGALEEDNIETVIGQYTQLDIVLEVVDSRHHLYVTDTDPETGKMSIYQIEQ